jgi:hypothetical protein
MQHIAVSTTLECRPDTMRPVSHGFSDTSKTDSGQVADGGANLVPEHEETGPGVAAGLFRL